MSSYQQVVTDEVLAQIESKSDEQRANRQMSAEVVQSLKDCGFYRMMLPKKWGGMECKPQEFFAEQIRIAEADMSTAWASGIIAVHAFQIALMSEEAQREVYADDPNTLVSSSYNPVGAVAESCDGGFMLSGRWGWSSGSGHCSWRYWAASSPATVIAPFSYPGPNTKSRIHGMSWACRAPAPTTW